MVPGHGENAMVEDTEMLAEPVRLPGLYRAWEIGCLIRSGRRYSVEGAGATLEGAPLYAIYAVADETLMQGAPA